MSLSNLAYLLVVDYMLNHTMETRLYSKMKCFKFNCFNVLNTIYLYNDVCWYYILSSHIGNTSQQLIYHVATIFLIVYFEGLSINFNVTFHCTKSQYFVIHKVTSIFDQLTGNAGPLFTYYCPITRSFQISAYWFWVVRSIGDLWASPLQCCLAACYVSQEDVMSWKCFSLYWSFLG